MQKIILGFVLFLLGITVYSIIDIITTPSRRSEPAVSRVETAPAKAEKPPRKKVQSVAEKKKEFIETLLPVVRKVKAELDAQYEKALRLSRAGHLTPEQRQWLDDKMKAYNVKGIPCLLKRMHTHPVSLVIAQAALETGWGKSRFYKEAKNVFGIWSYHTDEPRMAASKMRGEKTIYVKKFDSLEAAIRGYFKMIADGYAYAGFRDARARTDNPFELLGHLRNYSELRDEYVARLYYVIKANRLYRYDEPSYPPVALSRIVPQYVAAKRKEALERKLASEQEEALNEVRLERSAEDLNATDCNDSAPA